MTSSPSILGRAVLALVLMIGFYILALAIAAGLAYIPYAEMVYANRLHIKLALICVFGALAILWSVLPRFDKFTAPGPELKREEHPRLFEELESVAKATNQAMPAEVYLVHDVNAWVMQRGGLMGLGSKRVMGLGLPLMRLLTRAQFRAVLAHEFGHYHGGDTKVGPWIYKTRNAIGRTLESLGEGSWLQLPFLLYGKMFLRVTHAVSRRQEFVADELAARAVGSQPLIGGLRTVHAVGPAFQAYWFNECRPVFNAGFRAPLVEGFEQFIAAPPIAEAISKQLDEELKEGKADPYDTHPPLKERIAAVEHLPAGDVPANDAQAITLLNGLPEIEHALLVSLAGAEEAGKLKSISWNEVCAQVYVPQWQKLVNANSAALGGVTPESLPAKAASIKAFANQFVGPDGQRADEEGAAGLAGAVIGAAIASLLVSRDGVLDSPPGKAVTVKMGAASVEPFGVLSSLTEGKLTAEAWLKQCGELEIMGVDLASVVKEKT